MHEKLRHRLSKPREQRKKTERTRKQGTERARERWTTHTYTHTQTSLGKLATKRQGAKQGGTHNTGDSGQDTEERLRQTGREREQAK